MPEAPRRRLRVLPDREGPLHEPLTRLLGRRTAKALATSLGIETVGALLRHVPRRYVHRGELTDLASLRVDEDVTVFAEVKSVTKRQMRTRKGFVIEAVVTDGHDELALTFFNQAFRERELTPGQRGMFAGKVGVFKDRRQLTHPDYQLFPAGLADVDAIEAFAAEMIPIYPASAALTSWQVAKAVRIVLDTLHELDDPVPEPMRTRQRLPGLLEAFRLVHRPAASGDWVRGRSRLRWDEAFVLQTVLAQRRSQTRALAATPRVPRPGGLLAAFDAALPFELTAGQREVGETILADLARDHPMHRLLQGEVGSGKTVVALRAMLAVVDAGGQAALLAPTEVLAQQHYRSISELLGPLATGGQLGGHDEGTRLALLTGSASTAHRRAALLDTVSGQAGIVIGTHALLQERVDFLDLGLVVVDEQHRFGVEQRDALRAKAATPPHVLVMTATPIPRTVAMTVFGDLEVATLTELPLGRASISTHVVPAAEKPHYLDRAWERVREEVLAGHQAYVVCPRIGDDGDAEPEGDQDQPDAPADPSEATARRPPKAVLDVATELEQGPLAGLRLAVLHGRLPAEDKDAIMRGFTAGAIDVLVATTVIEVGVDVPNATAMVVFDADRFGVSQLHQLRGRVGRGAAPAVALLVTEAEPGSPARERLDAVAATLDGFELSLVDLRSRREGDVLGAEQSGTHSSLRLLRVTRDEAVIRAAREEASALVDADPTLDGHPVLRAMIEQTLDPYRVDYLEKG